MWLNKCKNLKIKVGNIPYCKVKNKEIVYRLDCVNCKYYEFDKKHVNYGGLNRKQDILSGINKKTSKRAKNGLNLKSSKPSKRTKELSISKDVKLIVWERDNHRCIFCQKYVEWNYANSHFIKRSHGGLGIEQNIMTNCERCHNLFDDSKLRDKMLVFAEGYLKTKYDNWNKDDLIYKK